MNSVPHQNSIQSIGETEGYWIEHSLWQADIGVDLTWKGTVLEGTPIEPDELC
jgi:hypothetical protein